MWTNKKRKDTNGKIRINFRMSQEDFTYFTMKKKEANLKTSEFFEKQILSFKLYFLEFEELKNLKNLLNQYGIVVNNIAKKINSEANLHPSDMLTLNEKFFHFEQNFLKFLSAYEKYLSIKFPKKQEIYKPLHSTKKKQPDFFITSSSEEKLRLLHKQVTEKNNFFNIDEFYTRILLSEKYICINLSELQNFLFEATKIRNNFFQIFRKLSTKNDLTLYLQLKKIHNQFETLIKQFGKFKQIMSKLFELERNKNYGSLHH